MDNQRFPTDVEDWTWNTIQSLAESGQSENLYLEYKHHLQYPEENSRKSETEWKRNVEREFTAFANASGGIILFGMNDDGEPAPFSPPEHEVSKTVSQLIEKTTPLVETDVSNPLRVPSNKTDRIALAVRIYEASRKPVATSDSAYYVRINDQKQPMNREQIESLFIEADRRQQAVRQLEMEIDRFHDVYESSFRNSLPTESAPQFHLIGVSSLKQVLRKNNHLYSDENVQGTILGIFNQLREIDSQEQYYERVLNGVVDTFYHENIESFNRQQQQELQNKTRRLHELFEQLVQNAGLNALGD